MAAKKIVAGNWKMNKKLKEGQRLAKNLCAKVKPSKTEIVLAPPYTHLASVAEIAKSNKQIKIAAQNCHEQTHGAFTGEVSAEMLKSVGVHYIILGHSERRQYFDEDNELLAAKVDAALAAGLKVIFCCGEPLAIREKKKQVVFVNKQIREGLFHLSPKAFSKIVIAYEPIWAIGTGVTASPEQAQQMHAKIRQLLIKKYGEKVAGKTSILYGGSVKPANAETLFENPDVDGGLVGGASLDAKNFMAIIDAF